MMNRSVLALLVAATSLGFASVGSAEPHPPPGLPPRAEADYAARVQRAEEERRVARVEQMRDVHGWEAGRVARADDHRRWFEHEWGHPFLDHPEVRAAMALHAERLARINRLIDLYDGAHNAPFAARARAVLAREIARDGRVMGEFRTRFAVR